MKTWWERKYTSTVLALGTKMEVCGQLHAPAAFPPEKSPPVPIG
jgi:hypothetical protein